MGENNLPALIVRPLTEYPRNLVYYHNSKNYAKIIFCESVSAFNGWITMTNVRYQIIVYASINPIKPINYPNLYYSASCDKKSFSEEAYNTITNKILPEKIVQAINSYNEGHDIELWALTSEEEGVNKANERVKKHNEKTLKANCKYFTKVVDFELDRHLDNSYRKLIWFQKKFNKENDWKRKQRTLPEFKKVIEEKIELVKKEYHRHSIEYEGTLEYKPDK